VVFVLVTEIQVQVICTFFCEKRKYSNNNGKHKQKLYLQILIVLYLWKDINYCLCSTTCKIVIKMRFNKALIKDITYIFSTTHWKKGSQHEWISLLLSFFIKESKGIKPQLLRAVKQESIFVTAEIKPFVCRRVLFHKSSPYIN
jgi:hypothetical protein